MAAFALVLAQTPTRAQEPSERFRRFDRNGDGKLTRDELPEAARANFDRVDTNKDGVISPAEDLAFRQPLVPFQLPDSVRHLADLHYAGTDNPRQKLDLLLPRKPNGEKPLPVIVHIHGGAWMGGERQGGLPLLAPFVASGDYAGVTVGYRLSGESTWPAQIHDCKAALRWVRANAKAHNLDPDRIGLIGPSAGGHLVALLGTSGDSAALEGDLGLHQGVSTRVRCVVDEFGPADLLTIGQPPSQIKHDAPNSPEGRLLGGAIHDRPELARAASPTTYVSSDDPPFLIIHGTKDDTVPFDQSVRLTAALKKAGVSTLFIPVEGGGHGQFRSPELDRRIRLFFDKHLRGQDATIPDDPVKPGQGPAEKPAG
jgi:acetyl esterase/lipase